MRRVIQEYSFSYKHGTVTLTHIKNINLDRLLLITNITANRVIYHIGSPGLSGAVYHNVVQLAYDTSHMHDNDVLQIIYATTP